MDRTNCSEGYASDRVMLYGDDFVPFSCNVSLAVYIGVFVTLTLIRGTMCLVQFRLWIVRERRVQVRTGKKRNRLPLLPLLSCFSFSCLAVFTILTSTNVANSSNGAPLMILTLFFFTLSVTGIFMAMRIINLGKKIIPLSMVKLDNERNNPRLSQLEKSTGFLKLIFVLEIVVIAISPITAFVGLFSPVFSTFQIAVVCYPIQNVLIGCGVGYQYQRVIKAIQACEFSNSQGVVIGRNHQNINRAVKKLQFQQLSLILCGPWTAMVWVLTVARVILPVYW